MLLPADRDMLDQYCMACTCMQSGQVVIQRLPSTLTRLIAKQKLASVATAEEPVTANSAFPKLLVQHPQTCALGGHGFRRRRFFQRRPSSIGGATAT